MDNLLKKDVDKLADLVKDASEGKDTLGVFDLLMIERYLNLYSKTL